MFEAEIELIQTVFSNYFGNGKYLVIFVIALIVLAIEEKKRENKDFLVYYTCVMLAIIFNPIFCYIITKIVSTEVYYRFWWTIPIGIIIAYFGTMLVSKLDKKITKLLIGVCLVAIIMYSGGLVYNSQVFQKVDNWYKVPDEYVQVAQILGNMPLDNKKAVTSIDLVSYIRQIDASIKLSYQRRPYGDYDIFKIVEYYYNGDIENLTNLCKKENTNIIVYEREVCPVANFSMYGFELYAQTANYDIYVLDGN